MEDGYFQVANVISPLTPSTANSSLLDADPVLFYLTKYFTGIANLHLGPRWDAECTAAGLSSLVGKRISQVLPYDPFPLETEDQYKFPFLAAFRTTENYEFKSVSWYVINSEIQVVYVLPPLTSDQLRRLSPLITHLARTFVDRTVEGLDTNFNSGERIWHEAGLDQIGMSTTEYGKIKGQDSKLKSNLYFYGISCTLLCKERRMPVTGNLNFVPFAGFDGYISNTVIEPYDGYSGIPVDVVDVKKDF